MKERNNYLGPRRGTARDVTRKLFDVGNHNGFPRRVSVPTNSFIKIDPRTRKRALERTEDELSGLFKIESHPEETKRFFQNRRYVREIRNRVRFARDQCIDLRQDLGVNGLAARGF